MVNRRFCGMKSGDKNPQNKSEIEKRYHRCLFEGKGGLGDGDGKKANVACSPLFEREQPFKKRQKEEE